MVGRAVATMVWSSAPRNIASMMPARMPRIAAWSSGAWRGDAHAEVRERVGGHHEALMYSRISAASCWISSR